MLFAAVVVYMLWQQQQHQFELQQKATARAIALSIEKQLEGTVRQLEYMASSPLLDSDAYEEFARNAGRALETGKHWSNVIVFAVDGQQLLNTRFPKPTMRTPIGQAHVLDVIRTARPMISDVFTGPASGRLIVAVTVPVVREGRVAKALSASLEFAPLDQLIEQTSAADNTVVTAVWDRKHRFISRSISADAFRGRQPVAALVKASSIAAEGWQRFTTIEGTEVFTAWTPVGTSGWSVGVAVSSAAADAALRRYLWALAIAEALILLTTIPVALRLGREARERAQAEAERDRLFALEHEARAVAETANKAKDEFLAMLGHELRNPLAAISNAVQLLESGKTTPEAVAFARSVISRQTAHLTRLIDDLLDVGRVITGKIFLQREVVDLASIARNAVSTVRAAGKAAAHRLSVDATSVFVEADRTRLEQVVVNLLANALTYTPSGGSVHLSLRREGADAVLTVRDSGIGLSPEELERVFELFYQAKGELHRKGGLGLGLTLVRRLVELHGGCVTVTSEGAGKGAEFIVRLAAVDSPSVAVKVEGTGPRRTAGRSILLIEDNEDARQSLAQVLSLDGHRIHEAPDGASGVEAATRLEPDIALIDIGLPRMDGYEVARTIRARTGRRMTLVALTGYGQPEDEQRAREAGFDAHLVKPADIEKLRAVIARDTPAPRAAGTGMG